MSKIESKAHGFFLQGCQKHAAFERGLKQVRRDGIDAAFYFVSAREAIDHGQWLNFLDLHKERIAPRTVQFYCKLAEEAIAWVREAQPQLKTITDVQAAAREMVMQSPKPLVALCRELGFMRKFGEYDAVKYQQKKIGNGQIEFNFKDVFSTVDLLTHFGDENFNVIYPEGKDELEAITELENKLETALQRVRQIKKNGRVIEA